MLTITTRELKQNPAAAIRTVLESGQPATITSYGKSTGVVIAPEGTARRQWVPGRVLAESIPPLSPDEEQEWSQEIARGRETEFGRDLWENS